MADEAILTVPLFSMLCNEAFRLRRAVFIDEQGIPAAEEFDADDFNAIHMVAVAGGEVRGTLRVIHAPEHVKIGRVAMARDWRGRGLAGRMMSHALDAHREVRGNRFFLSAQADKVGFYRRFGFEPYGESYLDGGIPHFSMKNY